MGYRSLQEAIPDLEATQQLRKIDAPLSSDLEVAAVTRRVHQAGGPALLFLRPTGNNPGAPVFPLLSNLFGTKRRAEYLFRDTLDSLAKVFALKADPQRLLRDPLSHRGLLRMPQSLLPKWIGQAPCLEMSAKIRDLPHVVCWPKDGGAFVTLPQVYSEQPNPDLPPKLRRSPTGEFAKRAAELGGLFQQLGRVFRSNLGMYRVQLSGGMYLPNEQVGLHYQLHRGLGVHHTHALERGLRLPVSIFVGGPPAMALAAVMPLPEGLPELFFAGALLGKPLRVGNDPMTGNLVSADADFVIQGHIATNLTLPEGPFGDHLGYYAMTHDFPVLQVDRVTHRRDAIWPFTVVGRPPQEDTVFGELIHELVGPVVPTVLPGVSSVHAVDAAGVHPLLLAVGSERYHPYQTQVRPEELLTQANAILGHGQMSLAKFLLIVARQDDPALNAADIPRFLQHLLERFDPRRDLHFFTETTIDTLDYSGSGLNRGSKLVMAAVGPRIRKLSNQAPEMTWPDPFREAHVAFPGVLAIQGPTAGGDYEIDRQRLVDVLSGVQLDGFPLVLLVDNAQFVAASLRNFLWVAFTKSNPAIDVDGVGSFTSHKHWGATGALVLDARSKPHHAPPLEESAIVAARIEALAVRGGPLAGLF